MNSDTAPLNVDVSSRPDGWGPIWLWTRCSMRFGPSAPLGLANVYIVAHLHVLRHIDPDVWGGWHGHGKPFIFFSECIVKFCRNWNTILLPNCMTKRKPITVFVMLKFISKKHHLQVLLSNSFFNIPFFTNCPISPNISTKCIH